MRGRALLAALAAAGAVACLDIGAPPGGIAAFSTIVRPSPSVVVGDTMRDSTGAAAQLRAYALDENGDTLRDVEITFLSIDTSTPPAITVQPDGTVLGDSVRPAVAGALVVANIGGRFQTPPDTIRVTVPPERSKLDQPELLQLALVDPADSMNTGNQRALRLTVSGSLPAGAKGAPPDTFAVGFVVDYRIFAAPPGTDGDRHVRLYNDGGKQSTRDTTSASEPGVASLKLQFNPALIDDPDLISGAKVDTVKVEVTVRYLGQAAAQTPDTFVVPIRVGPPPT